LLRQLKRLGITDLAEPPDREAWRKAVVRISEHYRHVEGDRNLLARSLELSTKEMTELHKKLAGERDRLRNLMTAIGDALTVFHDVAHARVGIDATKHSADVINLAKRRFARRLEDIFPSADATAEPDDMVNEIRTNFLDLADQLVRLIHETADKASLK